MDPASKRRVRLVMSLSVAVLLLTALIYKSFTASSEARTPSQLLTSAQAGQSYQMTGKVVDGTIRRDGLTTRFLVSDRKGGARIPVIYTGSVPDTFRGGREIILTVRKQGTSFVGDKDSLITKCPSKFVESPATPSQPS
jgi:cytochrome c-type biogenesis protein CcmE